jgi:hypothetical protein
MDLGGGGPILDRFHWRNLIIAMLNLPSSEGQFLHCSAGTADYSAKADSPKLWDKSKRHVLQTNEWNFEDEILLTLLLHNIGLNLITERESTMLKRTGQMLPFQNQERASTLLLSQIQSCLRLTSNESEIQQGYFHVWYLVNISEHE